MLLNQQEVLPTYVCKKRVMEYLVYKCGLSFISHNENLYYFTDNTRLRACVKTMPLTLKLRTVLGK